MMMYGDSSCQVTVGIITCNRPRKLEESVESLIKRVRVPIHILIVDSSGSDVNLPVYQKYPWAKTIRLNKPIPPGAARKLIADNAETPYTLFLDDDLVIAENTFDVMYNLIISNKFDIVSGIWNEYGRFREACQEFHFGKKNGVDYTWKSYLQVEELKANNIDFVMADSVHASMLVDNRIFKRVNFDSSYQFYYELWDFFLQCQHEEIRVGVSLNALFQHKPVEYKGENMRSIQDKNLDQKRFTEKWGFVPDDGGSMNLNRGLFSRIYSKVRRSLG